MTSKWAIPDPPPVTHPAFVPVDVDTSAMTDKERYWIRLVRESLVIAYERTPWHHSIGLITRTKHDGGWAIWAMNQLCDPAARLRCSLRAGPVERGKTIMVATDRKYEEGKEPWGPAPKPEQPMSPEAFKREYMGDFPPPVKPDAG